MTTPRPRAFYRFIGAFGNNRIVTRVHTHVYRLTGGRWLIGRNLGVLNVVLTTTGRQSGRTRDVPLFAFRDGDRIVVVGSKGGADREPGWVWNLRADPHASVRIGQELRAVRGHEAGGEERERLWSLVVAGYPGYELYQQHTARRIPVVVLSPMTAATTSTTTATEA